MNRFFKNTVALFLLALSFSSCRAQKFTTHAVEKGETIESIAKTYKVTPYTILQLNKEIKQGDTLKPNTILVIPKGGKLQSISQPTEEKSNTKASGLLALGQEEPTGFTSHRVRKKETLYSIAKRFSITEEDIKKYNPKLYSSQLKKKMTLKIPKYRRVRTEENTINEDDFETYTVAPKETRWSIAHKYGITIDSMLVLNPELSKATNYIATGQELRMPKMPGSSVENQETQLYLSYTVPPKMNFYQLEKKFGIKSDEIVRLNPEITERGGLKDGMVIRIPQQKLDAGDVNTDNFNFYEVKPKQTEFSLTRKFGISYKELLALNPDLQDGLKAGMVLKIPKEQEGDFEVRNSLVLDKINLVDSIDTANRSKILFLLPFRMDKLDFSDKSEVSDLIDKRSSLKLSLGLYSGALIAFDSIADFGVSVDVATHDNQYDLAKTKEILAKTNIGSLSAIVGPIDLASLKETAVRAGNSQVPVIAPGPADSDLSLSNVYYSYTSDEVLRNSMLDYIEEKRDDRNLIVIADSTHLAAREAILARFPDVKIAQVIEEEKNIGVNIEKLRLLLSDEAENWIIVETNNFKLATSVTSILNSFQNALLNIDEPKRDRLKVRMFTTDRDIAFENDVVSSTHLSNLRFTYPSVYKLPKNDTFSKRYVKRFGTSPDRYAVRGFDITYDLLLKLAYKNNLMEASKFIGETEYSGNKFNYKKNGSSGYSNQSSYLMTYEDLRIKEVE